MSAADWSARLAALAADREQVALGGGPKAAERQHAKGRLTARERIAALLDPAGQTSAPMSDAASYPAPDPAPYSAPDQAPDPTFDELMTFAGWELYPDEGGAPAGGVITGIGKVAGRDWMIIANDATVKAGAFFPITAKKVIRAQTIAQENRLPTIYLVDSAGVYLPLQDEIFPDQDDFGRVFYLNARMSAAGIPQLAAIMGNCVAGGAYLPVMCDALVMTDGSGLYLAGPALVKAAIGQDVASEELGGAAMHAEVSGTVDYREPDDDHAILRLRRLAATYAESRKAPWAAARIATVEPRPEATGIEELLPADGGTKPYEMLTLLEHLLDGVGEVADDVGADDVDDHDVGADEVDDHDVGADDRGATLSAAGYWFDEYKADYGKTIVCGTGKLGGYTVGVVANQKRVIKNQGRIEIGGVIYAEAADKAARFVLNCNQTGIPILFLHDVNGFMVGRESERGGIIRRGAKLVNAVSNSVVPRLSVIIGGSYGAGHYAMSGKAFGPRFIFALPSARFSVMGGTQAAKTVLDIQAAQLRRAGVEPDDETLAALHERIKDDYDRALDIRYAAARLWVDEVLAPAELRPRLIRALDACANSPVAAEMKLGVFQV